MTATRKKELTAVEEILLAAHDLQGDGKREFSEWDLTVSAWRRNRNRFGCRGYEEQYPDHKRVMMEIMSQQKKDNPLRRGLMQKTRPNHYSLTPLGNDASSKLLRMSGEVQQSERSPQDIYDAIEPYATHRIFRQYCSDPAEPRMWLSAASFLGLTSNDARHLEDRIVALKGAIAATVQWMDETGKDQIRRGVTGGGVAITRTDVMKLQEMWESLQDRFKIQLSAIRGNRP